MIGPDLVEGGQHHRQRTRGEAPQRQARERPRKPTRPGRAGAMRDVGAINMAAV